MRVPTRHALQRAITAAGEPLTGPPRPRRALTAAGGRINLDKVTGRTLATPQEWQTRAWQYRDQLGEIRYAMAYLTYAVSRCRVFPAVVQPGNDDPVTLDEAENVPPEHQRVLQDIVDRLTMGTGRWGHLVPAAAHLMEIAGEAIVVGRVDPETGVEVWDARSTEEVTKTDRAWRIIDVPGAKTGVEIPPGTSFVARVWTPHPRWRGLADSPMRSLLDPCEELAIISRTVRSTGRSRVAGAGILAVPDGLDFPGEDDFMTALERMMTASLGDEASAGSVVPGTIRGDGDLIAKIKHLTFDRPLDPQLIDREQAALRRLGAGLDVPPEIVTGMGDLNHWSAWQVDSATIKMHVQPLVIRVLDAITAAVIRPLLLDAGLSQADAALYCLWHSPDPLTVRPNRGQDADEAFDRNAISFEAYREAKGFADGDAPTDDELAQRLMLGRGAMDGAISQALMRVMGWPGSLGLDVARIVPPGQVTVHEGVDAQDAERGNPPAAAPTAPAAIGQAPAPVAPQPTVTSPPTGQTPGPETGITAAASAPRLRLYRSESARLARIDTDTRERIAAAADAALTRAVERAANRARGAAQREPQLRAIAASASPDRVCAVLGEDAIVAGLGLDVAQLLAGAWDSLAALWASSTAASATAAARVVARVTGQPVPAAALATLAQGTEAGWGFLHAALTREATRALFDPEDPAGVPDRGEDPGQAGRVTSLTRGALATAGGVPPSSPGVSPDGTIRGEGAPAGGVATGGTLMSVLTDAGVTVVGYEWVYGVSRNVFEPHAELDGLIVSGFSSPALANRDGWPGPVLAPGDHTGCHCDLQPILGDGTPTSALLDQAGDDTYDPAYLDVLRDVAATDQAEGRATTVTDTVAEADRIAAHRPSRRS